MVGTLRFAHPTNAARDYISSFGQFTIQGMPNLSTHMPKPLEKKVLPNGISHGAALGQRVEAALGIGGILDLQRDGKALRLMVIAGRGVGRHQHLAVDR